MKLDSMSSNLRPIAPSSNTLGSSLSTALSGMRLSGECRKLLPCSLIGCGISKGGAPLDSGLRDCVAAVQERCKWCEKGPSSESSPRVGVGAVRRNG